MDKIKVLLWADYCCNTGFGSVTSNIWQRLMKTGRYDLDVIGINFTGDPYDYNKWPGEVYTAMSGLQMQGNYADPYGRQKMLDMIGQKDYDIVFLLQDTFILKTIMEPLLEMQQQHKHPFKTIFYFPIDAAPDSDWITETASKINFPVAYTQYGFEECIKADPTLKDKLKIIYHGNNFNDFYVLPDQEKVVEFRHHAFRGDADNKFLLVNVNRNQRRKDIARTLFILKELRDRGINDVVLYLHMAYNDVGGNIVSVADQLGLEANKDYMVPEGFNPHDGLPVEILNLIYNAADALITTTHSEGWGLSISEAMATKTPIIAPRNSSLVEMLADNRGYLVDCGTNPSMWIVKEQDNDRLRPLMDVEQAADRVIDCMQGKRPDVEAAYKWIHNLSWDNVAQQWDALLQEAHKFELKRITAPKMAIPRKIK